MAEEMIMNQAAEVAEEAIEKAPVLLNNWQVGGALGASFGLGALVGVLVTKAAMKKKAEPKQEKEHKGFFKNLFKKKEKLEPGQVEPDAVVELPDEEPVES